MLRKSLVTRQRYLRCRGEDRGIKVVSVANLGFPCVGYLRKDQRHPPKNRQSHRSHLNQTNKAMRVTRFSQTKARSEDACPLRWRSSGPVVLKSRAPKRAWIECLLRMPI